MARKRIEGYWLCSYCGKEVGGLTKTCPYCGNPQSKGVKFRVKDGPKKYLEPEVAKDYGKGADWVCSFCGSYNRYNDVTCRNCGAGKADADGDYFGREVKVTPKEDYNSDEYMSDDEPLQFSEESKDTKTYEAEQSLSPWNEEESSDSIYKDYYRNSDTSYHIYNEDESKIQDFFERINVKKMFGIFGGIVSIIAIIMLLISVFTPKTFDARVSDKEWNRSVTIQELRTVKESDWDVPPGGRVYDEKKEIRDYDKVIDHYEIEEKKTTRQEFDHYDYEYYDNGDGTFDEEEIPVYKDVEDVEYEEVPVYKKVPIYDIKYYYEIDRWLYGRTESSSGKTDSPYWPKFKLASKEKEAGKDETYTVYFETEEKIYSKRVSYKVWKGIQLEDTYNITVVAGTVTEFEKKE